MNRSWLFLALVLLIFSACVPNRKYVYLQRNDVNAKDLPKDTTVRSYALKPFDYKVQPQDLLSVQFESLTPKEYDFFSGQEASQMQVMSNLAGGGALLMGELIDNEGAIPFPVLGKIKVAGLTVFQIQDTLQIVANRYLESPIVKVRLLNYRITVLGEVNKEGTIVLANNRVSILEALGWAGGLGELADRGNIKLIREKNGKTEVAYINLLDENFIHSPYYFVHQNDVLVVPALKQRPFRRYFGPNFSLITSAFSLLALVSSIFILNNNNN